MIPLVYSTNYNITAFGLERLHPFDSRKYRRIHAWLIQQGLRKPAAFVTPQPCSQADLLRIHTAEYFRSLRDRRVLARILEVPVVRLLPAWLTACRRPPNVVTPNNSFMLTSSASAIRPMFSNEGLRSPRSMPPT
jgi:histone deacetylase 11